MKNTVGLLLLLLLLLLLFWSSRRSRLQLRLYSAHTRYLLLLLRRRLRATY